jgi:hypothetical protein
MNVGKNVKNSRWTTGVGFAIIAILLLKLLGVDVAEFLGMTNSEVVLYIGAAISSVLLIFSKDPNK